MRFQPLGLKVSDYNPVIPVQNLTVFNERFKYGVADKIVPRIMKRVESRGCRA